MTQEEKVPEVSSLSFRQAMAELDATVAALESNSLELEDSLVKYERGVALLRDLRARLDSAQQKVDTLMGELEETISDEEIDSGLNQA